MYAKLECLDKANYLLMENYYGRVLCICRGLSSRQRRLFLELGVINSEKVNFTIYKSEPLEWKKDWNEIVVTKAATHDDLVASFQLFLNGKCRHIMLHRRSIYGRNDERFDIEELLLGHYMTGPKTSYTLHGWIARIMVLSSVLNEGDINNLRTGKCRA
jgi:hypothetical protein